MSDRRTISFHQALNHIERTRQDHWPTFNQAFRALHEYQRFWELAELDLLYPPNQPSR